MVTLFNVRMFGDMAKATTMSLIEFQKNFGTEEKCADYLFLYHESASQEFIQQVKPPLPMIPQTDVPLVNPLPCQMAHHAQRFHAVTDNCIYDKMAMSRVFK